MNRRIKFKAWNIAHKKMHDDITHLDNWSYMFLNKGFYTWLQFTGLFDKNGKEIYESDIVKLVVPNWGYDEIDNPNAPKYKELVSKIVYRHHGFWVEDEDFGWEGENLWDWDEIEVIGNIYENIELLPPKTT